MIRACATLLSVLLCAGSARAQDVPPPTADEAGAEFSRWGLFFSGNIGRGEFDTTDLTPQYDFDVNGLTAGIDYRWSDNLVVGAAVGWTAQDTDLSNNQGQVETNGFSVSGYLTWYSAREWYVDGVLAATGDDNNITSGLPLEIEQLSIPGTHTLGIGIRRVAGAGTPFMKYMVGGTPTFTVAEFPTNSNAINPDAASANGSGRPSTSIRSWPSPASTMIGSLSR